MKFRLNLTWRIWVLLVVLALSLISIFITPHFLEEGLVVTSVDRNSSAFDQGFQSNQVINAIDGVPVKTADDYANMVQEKFSSEESVKTIFTLSEGEVVYFSNEIPKITVSEIQKTNIKTGLDLSGGARALVQASDAELSFSDTADLAEMIENRLNVYGIEDIKVNPISDNPLSGEGNNYIRIEIAGATPEDLEELVSQQGKFEAKIGDEVVFTGEKKDITSVARSGQEAGIESCQQASTNQYFCNFRFTVYLSQDAAERHAEITETLGLNQTASGNYLDKKLDLYLDGTLIDSLLISEGLKGFTTTQISIQGSATGPSESEAYDNTQKEMNHLQTILITGSLPYKLEVVKLDTISPTLGKEFTRAILIAGIVALAAVTLIVGARYRKFKAPLALFFTSISEIIIVLGVAAFIRWNLDLPSIAGILATIGTGIDSQIIILDESTEKGLNLKQRLKRAFSIILGAYFTAVVAMLPLYWAVAGLFKGFAFTTILGISIGVLITRPAFSDIIKKIEKE